MSFSPVKFVNERFGNFTGLNDIRSSETLNQGIRLSDDRMSFSPVKFVNERFGMPQSNGFLDTPEMPSKPAMSCSAFPVYLEIRSIGAYRIFHSQTSPD